MCGEGTYNGGRRLTLGGSWESWQRPGCRRVRDGDGCQERVREGEQRAQRREQRADRCVHTAAGGERTDGRVLSGRDTTVGQAGSR